MENIMSVMPALIEKLPGKWSNISSLSLKTDTSIALPIYTSALLPNPPEKKQKTTPSTKPEITNENSS